MKPLVDDLGRDHQVLLVDGPGHGKSGGTKAAFSIDDCADAGIGVLDALGVRHASWIGAAWGDTSAPPLRSVTPTASARSSR